MRHAGAARAIPTVLLVVLAGCTDESGDDAAETTVGPDEVVADSDDRPEDADGDSCGDRCAVTTEEQKALIGEYVAAWNAQDVDALTALAGGDALADRFSEEVLCEYEAAFAADVTLSVDFDSCRTTLTAATGETFTYSESCLQEFGVGPPMSEEDAAMSLLHSGIPHEALAMGMLDDAAVEAFWSCGRCARCDELYTAEQKAVIEDYVAAFNAQDPEAITALISPEGRQPGSWRSVQEARCRHEALFAADLTLNVDFDDCSFEFSDATGRSLPPSANGPCLIGWVPFFEFADGGAGEQLTGSLIANDLLTREGTNGLDEQLHDSVEACVAE